MRKQNYSFFTKQPKETRKKIATSSNTDLLDIKAKLPREGTARFACDGEEK